MANLSVLFFPPTGDEGIVIAEGEFSTQEDLIARSMRMLTDYGKITHGRILVRVKVPLWPPCMEIRGREEAMEVLPRVPLVDFLTELVRPFFRA